MSSPRWLTRVLYFWLVLCVVVAVFGQALAAEHGLRRTVIDSGGGASSQPVAWPLVDGALPHWDRPQTIRLEGFVWQGGPGATTWRVIHNGGVTVRVDGQTVFQAREHGPLTADEFPVSWPGDWLALEIEYDHDPAALGIPGGRLLMAVYESAAWGWALLPTYRLYMASPDPALAAAEAIRQTLTTLALAGLLAGLLALGLRRAWRARVWQRREAWIMAALILAALLVRLVVLGERAAGDGYFYEPRVGADNYVDLARRLYSGAASLGGTWYQPGVAIWFVGVMRLCGPELEKLYVANAVLGAWSVGAIAGAGRLLGGRRAGIIAGLVGAFFPPLVFYHTTLLPVAVAAALTAWAALAGLWTTRRSSAWGAVAFGFLIGLAALVRPSTLVWGAALPVALLAARDRAGRWRGWRRVVGLTALAGLAALGTIAPQTLANRAAGEGSLISSNGPRALYAGNNRDGDGTAVLNVGQAWYVAAHRHQDWIAATVADVQADPLRAASLLLHKAGLFWGNVEITNNVSYTRDGVRASATLALLSLNGWLSVALLGWLAVAGLALAGAETGGTRGRALVWLLVAMIALYMLGTVAFYVIGRLRALVIPLLVIPAGLALDRLVAAAVARRADRRLLRAGAVGLAFLLMMHAFEYQLPRKGFFYGGLPAEAVPRADNLGGQVMLVGAGPVETDHRPGGYVYVTLYWQAIAPPAEDYMTFVHLVDEEGRKIAGKDVMLGGISHPPVGASDWPVGATQAESYLVLLQDDAPPILELHTGLYRRDSLARLPLLAPDGAPLDRDFVRLRALGLIPPAGLPALTGAVEAADYRLGDSLRISGLAVPARATPGGELPIGVQWEAVEEVWEDYAAFFHLVDAGMALVAQSDGPALGPHWPTSALIPGQPVGVVRIIELPDDLPPGQYLLRMGAYTYPSIDRLPARDAAGRLLPDGIINLATVRIE